MNRVFAFFKYGNIEMSDCIKYENWKYFPCLYWQPSVVVKWTICWIVLWNVFIRIIILLIVIFFDYQYRFNLFMFSHRNKQSGFPYKFENDNLYRYKIPNLTSRKWSCYQWNYVSQTVKIVLRSMLNWKRQIGEGLYNSDWGRVSK